MSCTSIVGLRPRAVTISFDSSSSSSPRRAVIKTLHPSSARPLAMARPMPILAPVTRAVFPFSCRSTVLDSSFDDCFECCVLLLVAQPRFLDHFPEPRHFRFDGRGKLVRRTGDDVFAAVKDLDFHIRLI